jgi:hypothetical protein
LTTQTISDSRTEGACGRTVSRDGRTAVVANIDGDGWATLTVWRDEFGWLVCTGADVRVNLARHTSHPLTRDAMRSLRELAGVTVPEHLVVDAVERARTLTRYGAKPVAA